MRVRYVIELETEDAEKSRHFLEELTDCEVKIGGIWPPPPNAVLRVGGREYPWPGKRSGRQSGQGRQGQK
jgi:hypothetical protein